MAERPRFLLGIETSCDETAAAVVADGKSILSNVISSQVDLHKKYGGVVPEKAARRHLELINPAIMEALAEARIVFQDLTAIAVTIGPGLTGALLVGMATAKTLAFAVNLPLVGVNHLEGHIYANFLEHPSLAPPFICLIVSGGHTCLVYMKDYGQYEMLGETLDDAAGEAFDKVAGFLGLGYPGGPLVDQLAEEGNPQAVSFPRAVLSTKGYNFSLSGLKTSVLNYVTRLKKEGKDFSIADICASFQEAIIEVQIKKTIKAVQERRANKVVLAGGVAANTALRRRFSEETASMGIGLFYPSLLLCTDNAAMVASAGYYHWLRGERLAMDADVDANARLG